MSVTPADPAISPPPGEPPIPPGLPRRQLPPPPPNRRARGIGTAFVALFVGVAVKLGILSLLFQTVPGALGFGVDHPTCRAAGITKPEAREGTCADRRGLFGSAVVSVVVNRANTLRMPGYDARLVRSTVEPTKVKGGGDDDYPGGRGWLASFVVSVTNRGDTPLEFDTDAQDISLIVPLSAGSGEQLNVFQTRALYYYKGPSLGQQAPIAPGATETGWAQFLVPIWARPMLRARPADLMFSAEGKDPRDFHGLIRLWK
jgi:hypothetical protein